MKKMSIIFDLALFIMGCCFGYNLNSLFHMVGWLQ